MTTEYTHHAAIHDGAIWGVGTTPEEAITDAGEWVAVNRLPEERAEVLDALKTVGITLDEYQDIDNRGFDNRDQRHVEIACGHNR